MTDTRLCLLSEIYQSAGKDLSSTLRAMGPCGCHMCAARAYCAYAPLRCVYL